ncbi:NAD(+)/NADH kinase [Agromyces archimandritae]|uniref:NAD(+)/NADH kinase n=2 Tax=Agromyces archimandritae TaxID=2781962 RepID=A0A975FS73_9MICO|nr:NAD(+)/NADH kinase [Agromyces archimandritae]
MPRAAIISNPSKDGIRRLREAVAHAERRQGFAPSLWIDTSADDPGVGQAREAVEAGVSLVVAAGGDGTVRAVASGLRGTGVPLGIVPAGTGNLFARNLQLPVGDLADAVVVAFSGVDRAVDVVVAEVERADGSEEAFASLVVAGVGIDAAMIQKTNPTLKRRFGWLAYVDGGFRALPASAPFHLNYRLDGAHPRRARASSVLIANLGSLPGNIELIPDAEYDDGKLDVALLQPRSVFGWFFVWWKVGWENVVMRRSRLGRRIVERSGGRTEIVYLRGREITVEMPDGPEEFEVDGDGFGEIVRARFRVEPAALIVRAAE